MLIIILVVGGFSFKRDLNKVGIQIIYARAHPRINTFMLKGTNDCAIKMCDFY